MRTKTVDLNLAEIGILITGYQQDRRISGSTSLRVMVEESLTVALHEVRKALLDPPTSAKIGAIVTCLDSLKTAAKPGEIKRLVCEDGLDVDKILLTTIAAHLSAEIKFCRTRAQFIETETSWRKVFVESGELSKNAEVCLSSYCDRCDNLKEMVAKEEPLGEVAAVYREYAKKLKLLPSRISVPEMSAQTKLICYYTSRCCFRSRWQYLTRG